MTIMGKRTWPRIAAIGLVASAMGAGAAYGLQPRREPLPFYTSPDLAPRWMSERRAEAIHRVAPFRLTDQDGRTVTERDVAGKVYVASFFFTRCQQLCPILGTGLRRVQSAFAADGGVLILSHSVTPEMDGVPALRRWAAAHGARGGRWHLLTGDRAQLRRLAERSYFVELSDTTGNTQGTLVHTETLVLVDEHGHLRGVYDGSLPYDVTQLIADLHTLRGMRDDAEAGRS